MATRRMPSSRSDKSWPVCAQPGGTQQQRHDQIVADHGRQAMVSTMTMPVAADKPPMNTSSASHSAPWASGRSARRYRD